MDYWSFIRSLAGEGKKNLQRKVGESFFDKLVDQIGESDFQELDKKIDALTRKSFTGDYVHNDRDVLCEIIDIVKFYNKLLHSVTEQNNISFASKYLHFHVPKLVFIIDSYTFRGGADLYKENSLGLCKKEKSFIKGLENAIQDYARHVFRCYSLTMHMGNISPRELDTKLKERGSQ